MKIVEGRVKMMRRQHMKNQRSHQNKIKEEDGPRDRVKRWREDDNDAEMRKMEGHMG